MVKLGVTVPYRERETATSFASRLAMRNLKPSARAFCLDMGLRFQDLVDGELPALSRLAELGDADPELLSRAALKKLDGRTFALGTEKLMPYAMRRNSVVFCIECIREDIASRDLEPALSTYGRVEWQLSAIRTCPKHNQSLTTVSLNLYSGQTQDFAAIIRPLLRGLAELPEATSRTFSGFERYVTERLFIGDREPCWLDGVGYSAATKACEVFGVVAEFGLSRNLKEVSAHDWATAADRGFGVLKDGYDSLRPFLSTLHSPTATTDNAGPQAMLGPIHQWLQFGSSDPDIEPICDLVRKYIHENTPVGPEDTLFGRPFPSRKLHSVRTASLQFGLHPKTLRKTLAGAGIVPPESSNIPNNHAVFDAEIYSPLLERLVGGMERKNIRSYLNIPRVHLDLVLKQGLIKPIIQRSDFDELFAPADLDAFLEMLSSRAERVDAPASFQMDIPSAGKRACCSALEIIDLIKEGQLQWTGKSSATTGYLALLVDVDEVRRLVQLPPLKGIPIGHAADDMGVNSKAWNQIIDLGILPVECAINPINRCPVRIIEAATYADFKAKYVSLRDLARDASASPKRLRQTLASHGIVPVERFNKCGAFIYSRNDLI